MFLLAVTPWLRVVFLQDYNTRVVVMGTVFLGIASGLIGTFTLLRRRALMGDALAHATLPGIAIAFITMVALGFDGKSLSGLLVGAAASGLLGVAAISYLRHVVRIREDAALGIVLSVFFGAGLSLLSIIQQMPGGQAAGLESFIYGKTASMIALDAWLILVTALFCIVLCSLLYKEWKLLCFDEGYAGARGYPTLALDLLLMTAVVLVMIVGLQAVGLVLMIAMMIIPATAARFWSDQLRWLMLTSAVIGAMSGWVGATISALFPNLPSGAMIVLVAATVFAISFLAGWKRGLIVRTTRRHALNRKMDRDHLLRELYESSEHSEATKPAYSIAYDRLLRERNWTPRRLERTLRRAEADQLISLQSGRAIALSDKGAIEAARLVREHRLWELYLITHADVAASRVDHEADRIEHVLGPEIIRELEALLVSPDTQASYIPPNPHEFQGYDEPSTSNLVEEKS